MTNAWKNMNTADLYGALSAPNPQKAMDELLRAKRAMVLGANRKRVKVGQKVMNEFHRRLMNYIEEYKEEYGPNYREELKDLPNIWEVFEDDEFKELIKEYMEWCYD